MVDIVGSRGGGGGPRGPPPDFDASAVLMTRDSGSYD